VSFSTTEAVVWLGSDRVAGHREEADEHTGWTRFGVWFYVQGEPSGDPVVGVHAEFRCLRRLLIGRVVVSLLGD